MSATGDETAIIYDAKTFERVLELRCEERAATMAAFSPDSERVVTGGSKAVRIRDVRTKREPKTLKASEIPKTFRSVSTSDRSRKIEIRDDVFVALVAQNGSEVVLRGHTELVNSAYFAPDGQRVVTASSDNTVRIWDVSSGAELEVLRGFPNDVTAASITEDGTHIVTESTSDLFHADNNSKLIWLWESPRPTPHGLKLLEAGAALGPLKQEECIAYSLACAVP